MREGLAYRIVGGVRFYERKEVKDALAYMRLVINPHDDVSLRRVINVPTRGIGKTSVGKLAEYARDQGLSLLEAARQARRVSSLNQRATTAIARFVEIIDRLCESATAPVEEILGRVLELTGYRSQLEKSSDPDDADRLANVQELLTAAREHDIKTGAVIDITERKRAEFELAAQRNELAHLARVAMLGELSGSLAHELNQPLTAILANARAMGEFGAVSVVSGKLRGQTTTLPLQVEILYQEYNFAAAFAVDHEDADQVVLRVQEAECSVAAAVAVCAFGHQGESARGVLDDVPAEAPPSAGRGGTQIALTRRNQFLTVAGREIIQHNVKLDERRIDTNEIVAVNLCTQMRVQA